jgi:carbon monoxide dehydrogenase subunit G
VEIEKSLSVAAPPERVWELLLDPKVMGGCVPGMQSIEVVSPTEYKALMAVKIAFVSAKFKLKTTIVEQRAPHYLRCEGTGEDASVASSMKQQSEIFLAPQEGGGTELKLKVKVDVLGRLGSFGLSVMKTKADRMWDEFGQNLVKRIDGETAPAVAAVPAAPVVAEPQAVAATKEPSISMLDVELPLVNGATPRAGWFARLLGRGTERAIRIEVKRGDTTVTVHWPVEAAPACAAMLREVLR